MIAHGLCSSASDVCRRAFPGAARDSGLLDGRGFALQSLAGVAAASEVSSCDKPRLRQAIAAMRANEIGGKPGVFFKVWVKLGAALELGKEFKQRSRAQGVNAPCKKGQAFGRKPPVLRWHGVSKVGAWRTSSEGFAADRLKA
jgi:hypothetical protein